MPTRRFDVRDFNLIAEEIAERFHSRKRNRKDLERQWDEVDRQLRMEPDISFKLIPKTDRVDPTKAWLPEVELPLQKQASEILVADARRMVFPDSGPWFAPHAELTPAYLERAEGIELGPEGERLQTEVPAITAAGENDFPLDDQQITQDEADKIILGLINHNHRQYGFRENIDLINAEAFKYGVGIGRGRVVSSEVHLNTKSGVLKETQKIPMLVPRSIRNTYLDDSLHARMNEGHIIGPGIITEIDQRIEDVQTAANRGSNDPNDENGGWMPAALRGLEGDDKHNVKILEFEGDLVVARKSIKSLFIPGVIVSVVVTKSGGKNLNRVIRFRFRQGRYGSYLQFPYHHEGLDSPYATAPLVGGMHIQKNAVQALNVFHQAAQLSARPPISWDRADTAFAQDGGPVIEPGRMWGTISPVIVHEFGDPSAILNAYLAFVAQYSDYTGINAARLGAQTVSHTTAFAKEAELSRGTVRTVDYVRSTTQGPLTRWLYMELEMTRRAFNGRQTIFLDPYQSFVSMTKKAIPDNAVFDVFGAGGPLEEQQKLQAKMAAVQQAVQIDGFKLQNGLQPTLNYDEIQRQILKEGGWIDVDSLIASQGPAGGATDGPALVGGPESGGDTADAVLQALGG